MYKSVVVGTDGSPTASQAVETAARLARDWGAKLHIVVAYSSSPGGMASAMGSALADTGAGGAAAHSSAEKVGNEAKEKLGSGIDAEVHAVSRHPADGIIEVAESVSADLIVVGSKGMTGARRVLGSVPNSVAHGAPCACLIVKTA
jgi:nucleotide-binding universal stress UspA family protein